MNLGQQMLIEILAGSGADLMVIGDDDQTIYEWRVPAVITYWGSSRTLLPISHTVLTT